MSRPLRIQFPGAFYHVMNRGISRSPIFFDRDSDRALFKQTLTDAVMLWKIRIHAYSLMDNHYHLLIETPHPNISRAMQHIDGIYTQRFNRKHGRDGPLIRGRFKSILVQEETYFLELVRYIHLNGVRARCFPSARVDTNCSHWDYIHPERGAPWLDKKRVLFSFAHDLQALDAFVHQGVSDSLQTILDRKRWPAILGAKDFIEDIRLRFLHSKTPTKDMPQVRQHQLMTIDPNTLLEEVLNLHGKYPLIQGGEDGELNTEGRWVLLTALRRYSHLSYQDIATLVGSATYDAIEKFIKRNDFTGSDFFKEVQRRVEAQMSDVEI